MSKSVKLSLIIMWMATIIFGTLILLLQLPLDEGYIHLAAWNNVQWSVLLVGLGVLGYILGDWKNLYRYASIALLYQLPFVLLYLILGVIPLEMGIDFVVKTLLGTGAGICGSNIKRLNVLEKRGEKLKKKHSVKI
ncbi:MAG: hypothetical protein KGZ94_12460 [Clostridia bacterium]|nr:hypothetical protein [Clostridia bacterium]